MKQLVCILFNWDLNSSAAAEFQKALRRPMAHIMLRVNYGKGIFYP